MTQEELLAEATIYPVGYNVDEIDEENKLSFIITSSKSEVSLTVR